MPIIVKPEAMSVHQQGEGWTAITLADGQTIGAPATEKNAEKHIVVNRARGKMLSHSASEMYVRDFPPVISDEPPSRGGENRGPSPLEYILIALCA